MQKYNVIAACMFITAHAHASSPTALRTIRLLTTPIQISRHIHTDNTIAARIAWLTKEINRLDVERHHAEMNLMDQNEESADEAFRQSYAFLTSPHAETFLKKYAELPESEKYLETRFSAEGRCRYSERKKLIEAFLRDDKTYAFLKKILTCTMVPDDVWEKTLQPYTDQIAQHQEELNQLLQAQKTLTSEKK